MIVFYLIFIKSIKQVLMYWYVFVSLQYHQKQLTLTECTANSEMLIVHIYMYIISGTIIENIYNIT